MIVAVLRTVREVSNQRFMESRKSWDSNQITREYFDSLLVEMRHIDAVIPSTKFELYGETFDTPVMMAALSHLNNIRENGMVEMARVPVQQMRLTGQVCVTKLNWKL